MRPDPATRLLVIGAGTAAAYLLVDAGRRIVAGEAGPVLIALVLIVTGGLAVAAARTLAAHDRAANQQLDARLRRRAEPRPVHSTLDPRNDLDPER
ncbi:hypothetical protein [Phenylobacterium sp.]|uniref:hypothetical protein n=1 Tax=Phenylobacterium sp. TaxID=1871053 RepID=UPI002F94E655